MICPWNIMNEEKDDFELEKGNSFKGLFFKGAESDLSKLDNKKFYEIWDLVQDENKGLGIKENLNRQGDLKNTCVRFENFLD